MSRCSAKSVLQGLVELLKSKASAIRVHFRSKKSVVVAAVALLLAQKKDFVSMLILVLVKERLDELECGL